VSFDFVVIGAGAAGEAATHYARGRGASVAVVDRDLFGGSCPFWACMPSKTLLHAAEVKAHGGEYPWQKASDRRDYMINRIKTDYPNDGSHVHALEKAGAAVFRGTAKLTGPGTVSVTHENTTHELRATDVIIAVGTEQREGSLALGATRWETVWRVVLPAARTGIFGACVLALGRAIGETIATTMVIGNRPTISASLFAPSYTLSSVIANEFTEATSDVYLGALIELGLVLFLVSIVVNGFARLLMWTMLRGAMPTAR